MKNRIPELLGGVGVLLGGILTNALYDSPLKTKLGKAYTPIILIALGIIYLIVLPLAKKWHRRISSSSNLTPVKDFFGRRDEIAKLRKILRPLKDRTAIVLIHGMSGLGKTQLARYIM